MSEWIPIQLGTNHKSGINQNDRHLFEVGVFCNDALVSDVVSYENYASYGTLMTFPQFGLQVKIRRSV